MRDFVHVDLLSHILYMTGCFMLQRTAIIIFSLNHTHCILSAVFNTYLLKLAQ